MRYSEVYAQYYDQLFPYKEKKEAFLLEQFSHISSGSSLLDIGCGTGAYTIALQEADYEVIGIDLNPKMIDLSREKAAQRNLDSSPRFKILDMRDLDVLYSPSCFCGIYSLGNVLIHLTEVDDVEMVIKKIFKVLLPEGVLVLQIINFDRILAEKEIKLPPISDEDNNVELNRRYRYDKANETVRFRSRITVKVSQNQKQPSLQQRRGGNVLTEKKEEETYIRSEEVYPLTSPQLEDLLEDAGFSEINFIGDFHGNEFDPEGSRYLIVTAQK